MKEAGHKRTSSEARLRVCVDPTAAGSTGKAESRTRVPRAGAREGWRAGDEEGLRGDR